jgi:hypothetical protein
MGLQGLKRDAVAQTWLFASDENEREDVLPVAEVKEGMHVHSIEDDECTCLFGETDIQPAYITQPVLICPVGNAKVRGDRQLGFPFQIFTGRCIKTLPSGRANPI